MAAFAEYIAENYRSQMDLTWDYPHVGYARAQFSPEKNALLFNVVVSFEQREPDGPWHASFEVKGIDIGSGVRHAFDVFNGVIQAVEEFLSVRKPAVLVIASKQEQLGRIYETYLRREAATIESIGYRLAATERIEPYTEFRIERVKPADWKE